MIKNKKSIKSKKPVKYHKYYAKNVKNYIAKREELLEELRIFSQLFKDHKKKFEGKEFLTYIKQDYDQLRSEMKKQKKSIQNFDFLLYEKNHRLLYDGEYHKQLVKKSEGNMGSRLRKTNRKILDIIKYAEKNNIILSPIAGIKWDFKTHLHLNPKLSIRKGDNLTLRKINEAMVNIMGVTDEKTRKSLANQLEKSLEWFKKGFYGSLNQMKKQGRVSAIFDDQLIRKSRGIAITNKQKLIQGLSESGKYYFHFPDNQGNFFTFVCIDPGSDGNYILVNIAISTPFNAVTANYEEAFRKAKASIGFRLEESSANLRELHQNLLATFRFSKLMSEKQRIGYNKWLETQKLNIAPLRGFEPITHYQSSDRLVARLKRQKRKILRKYETKK